MSDFASDGTFIPDIPGRGRELAREAQQKQAREQWRPEHPETERAWLFWRVVIEGVLSYAEADALPLERLADALEAAHVTADVQAYNRLRADAND